MKTAGEILKEARLKKDISLEVISKRTRVGVPYLQAIENNEFKKLPPAAFTKGFMRQYAKEVGLKPETVLAVFRRDYDQDAHGRVVPRGISDPTKNHFDVFNPTTTAIVIASVISLLLVAFFARQIFNFLSSPDLAITEPLVGAQVVAPFMVRGNTDAQSTLSINNRPVIVTEDGSFEYEVTLSEGDHLLIIKSTSRSNKTTTIQHKVSVVGGNAL